MIMKMNENKVRIAFECAEKKESQSENRLYTLECYSFQNFLSEESKGDSMFFLQTCFRGTVCVLFWPHSHFSEYLQKKNVNVVIGYFVLVLCKFC